MGKTKTTNRESRQSRAESVEAPVTLKVADATRIIESKVDDLRNEVGQDIDSKIVAHHMESGNLDQARERAEESGIEGEELKGVAGEAIVSLIKKGNTELAAKVAAEFNHDEDSLNDLLSDPDLEEALSSRIENELIAEETGSPLLRNST